MKHCAAVTLSRNLRHPIHESSGVVRVLMSHRNASNPTPEGETRPAPRWVVNAPVDVLIGCGGWTLLLLAVTYALPGVSAAMWSAVFYALALVANYPHYAATLHRACAARDDRQAYRAVLAGSTAAVAIAGVAAHVWFSLVPWIFTLYVLWSPWHYTGQNFGLAIMQLRRSGIVLTGTERWQIRTAFVVSYGLLLVTLNSGPKTDPMVLALGLPTSLAAVVAIAGGALFLVLGALAFASLERRVGALPILPAAVLFITQALWFVVPTLITTVTGLPAAPLRYSAGVLALMHAAQYLWITQYLRPTRRRVTGRELVAAVAICRGTRGRRCGPVRAGPVDPQLHRASRLLHERPGVRGARQHPSLPHRRCRLEAP